MPREVSADAWKFDRGFSCLAAIQSVAHGLMADDPTAWRGCGEEFLAILPLLFQHTECEDWKLTRPPLVRGEGKIYFLGSRSFRHRSIVLKIYQKDVVSRRFVRKLHLHNQTLHAASESTSRIPEPVFFLPEHDTMAMEFVNAPTAGSVLLKGFLGGARNDAVIRMAGRWLRWFHEQSDLRLEAAERKGIDGKLLNTAERIRRKVPVAFERDSFLNECLLAAGKMASRLEGMRMPHAMSHGDFTPFNLFVDGDTAIGIDYRVRNRRPVFYDMSRFLVYLDVCRVNHDHAGIGRIRPPRVSELRKYGCRDKDFVSFMDAYDPEGGVMDWNCWLGWQFLEVTRRMVLMKLPQANLLNRVFRLVENARLRRRAAILMEAL